MGDFSDKQNKEYHQSKLLMEHKSVQYIAAISDFTLYAEGRHSVQGNREQNVIEAWDAFQASQDGQDD